MTRAPWNVVVVSGPTIGGQEVQTGHADEHAVIAEKWNLEPHGRPWRRNGRPHGPSGPTADRDVHEDPEDVTEGVHGGQVWRYDERARQIELVALFSAGGPFDGPDNITVTPYGYALACTDGEDDQWLVGIGEDGEVFPFGFNRLNGSEFAGATFSPDGRTLFANLQEPGHTFAIYGPWRAVGRRH